MTQPGETQELKQIRERRNEAAKRSWMDFPPQPTWKDIDFLLSLIDTRAPVDSQGAGGGMSALLGYEQGFADAATQMRDACVERLGQVDRAHILSNNQDYERGFRDAIRSAQTALSSLTLDQVKQKEQSK